MNNKSSEKLNTVTSCKWKGQCEQRPSDDTGHLCTAVQQAASRVSSCTHFPGYILSFVTRSIRKLSVGRLCKETGQTTEFQTKAKVKIQKVIDKSYLTSDHHCSNNHFFSFLILLQCSRQCSREHHKTVPFRDKLTHSFRISSQVFSPTVLLLLWYTATELLLNLLIRVFLRILSPVIHSLPIIPQWSSKPNNSFYTLLLL